jgi:hypothetical protein
MGRRAIQSVEKIYRKGTKVAEDRKGLNFTSIISQRPFAAFAASQ